MNKTFITQITKGKAQAINKILGFKYLEPGNYHFSLSKVTENTLQAVDKEAVDTALAEMSQDIGNVLEAVIKENELSQSMFCKITGINPTTISKMLSKRPNNTTLEKLIQVFGTFGLELQFLVKPKQ